MAAAAEGLLELLPTKTVRETYPSGEPAVRGSEIAMDVEPQRGRKAFGTQAIRKHSPNNPTEGGAPFAGSAMVNPIDF